MKMLFKVRVNHFISLLSMFALLFALLFAVGSFATPAQAQNNAKQLTSLEQVALIPGTVESTSEIDSAVIVALESATIELPESEYFAITDISQFDSWYFISVAGLVNLDEDMNWNINDNATWLGLILLTQENNALVGAVQGSLEFSQMIDEIPDQILAPQAKNDLDPVKMDLTQPQASSQTYIFPWSPGTSMQYGFLGVHDNGFNSVPGASGWKAVDFLSGMGVSGEAPNDLRAAAAGTVGYKCSPPSGQFTTAIKVGDLFYTHLNNSSSIYVGKNYAQGASIGSLKTGNFEEYCGHAYQNAGVFHVHLGFPNTGSVTFDGWTLNMADGLWRKGGESRGVNSWFQSGGNPPSGFSKTSPSNGAAVTLDFQPYDHFLQWDNAGVNQYQYCVDTSNDNSCNGNNWNTRSSLYVPFGDLGLVAGTTYYWQVRTNSSNPVYANNGSWWSFTTAPGVPGAFSKISPVNGAVNQSKTPTLSWGASSGATGYEYCVGTSPTNSCVSEADWSFAGNTNSVTFSLLNPNTTYYWQVRAINSAGKTPANEGVWWSFITSSGVPGAFSKLQPADDGNTTLTPTLTWGMSPEATSYEYCVSQSSSSCANWVSVGNQNLVNLNGMFTPGQTYYWQIRAVNTYGSVDANNNEFWAFTATTFADVPYSHWAWRFVESLYAAGITGGCATNPLSYCPEQTVNRAQMAIFLLRAKYGSTYSPPAVGSSTGFADVPTNYWAAAWIKQLAAEGITGGCSAGNYCPENSVTRAQMAVFLLRTKYGSSYIPPAVGTSTGFADVPIGYWAAAWIKQLAAEGITGGCSAGNYCPEDSVTRAQMAVFLQRVFPAMIPLLP